MFVKRYSKNNLGCGWDYRLPLTSFRCHLIFGKHCSFKTNLNLKTPLRRHPCDRDDTTAKTPLRRYPCEDTPAMTPLRPLSISWVEVRLWRTPPVEQLYWREVVRWGSPACCVLDWFHFAFWHVGSSDLVPERYLKALPAEFIGKETH